MLISLAHLSVYLAIILLCVIPLGWYMAQVLDGKPCVINRVMEPIERGIARCCGVTLHNEMDWKEYLITMLYVNLFGMLFVYAIQRLQYYLPLNPEHFNGVAADLAFNTAASFVTNTNWQAYIGESTMSYLTQMLALTMQQFMSAATGIALMMAFIRGLTRHEAIGLGNFWQDMLRSILYILLPLSILFSVILVSQGVIQNFKPYVEAELIDPVVATTQHIPMGPVASMVAIKQLGSNGGGFFGVNAAHPFENPNLISNYLEMLAIILIPAALCYSFGILVNDRRQGFALLAVMILIFIPLAMLSMHAEQQGNPLLQNANITNVGNMEGKEVRFGPLYSGLWGSATTATANGSVNYMHDSAMPASGFVYLVFMQMGEIIFGGVGCGIYSMLLMVLIAVFIGGLMVGRTPEYLGKRIEPYEMKIVCLMVVFISSLVVLLCSAFSSVTSLGLASLKNSGAHGFSEILYAFTSMRNNNGSAFAGLNSNTNFYNVLGGIVMLIGRYWYIIGLMAVAGSLARKKIIPASSGTLATNDLTFILFLIGVIIIVGVISFLPALALGPVIEHLTIWGSL
jgi:K+-transporting ATPase ATPase A chain